MNIRLRIGPSRIHAHGLFATTAIPKGTRIIQYTGDKITKPESLQQLAQHNQYVFTLNHRYDIDGKSLENTARYLNHSCEPNCEAQNTTRAIWIVALRNIQAGEELTYDYGYEVKGYEHRPCRCGAQHCCGYMLGRQYWALIKKQERKTADCGE